jgi:rod shape-determining protein MreD
MSEKLFFALFGGLLAAAWVSALALQTTSPPQLLIVVCALGCLRLSKSAAVGGACLAGLIWDAFDWQVRLGTHAGALGISCFLLSALRSKLEISQPVAWPAMTALLSVNATVSSWILSHLLGVHDPMPLGWWWERACVHSLWLALLAVALLPWRKAFRSQTAGGDAPVSLIPLFME